MAELCNKTKDITRRNAEGVPYAKQTLRCQQETNHQGECIEIDTHTPFSQIQESRDPYTGYQAEILKALSGILLELRKMTPKDEKVKKPTTV